MFSDVKRGRVTQRCSRMLCRDAEFYQGGKRKATGRKTKEDKKKAHQITREEWGNEKWGKKRLTGRKKK